MADPLSIASSIVGILAAAGKVIEILGPYISAAKDTPKIAVSVHTEVVNSRIILSALHSLLDNLGAASRSRTLLVSIDDLIAVFTNGVFIFSELEGSISPMGLGSTDRIRARMQWARKESELSGILTQLQAFKNTTLLLLNILQCDSDRRAARTQDELATKIVNLLQNDDLSRRLGSLEDTFDALSSIEPRGPKKTQSRAMSLSKDSSDGHSLCLMNTKKPEYVNGASYESSNSPEPPFTMPKFEFQAALDESMPYRRAREDTVDNSVKDSVAASNSWSIFSGISLSDVSILSHIAIPVYPADILNAQHYEFMESKTTKVYTIRRPSEATIGKWAKSVRRVARPRQLRFDILFEVPVIFLCQPENHKGPLANTPIIFIDGSPDSLEGTMSDLPSVANPPHREREVLRVQKGAARTADVRIASYITLLSALQRLEKDSRVWERNELKKWLSSSTAADEGAKEPSKPSLVVALQRKVVSWSALPSNFKQPKATTTWCHIIELAAWLGMYWSVFDRSRDKYQAQGNGYTLSGVNVTNIGTVFTFQVHGRNRFEENRVIPDDGIKELCFGFVPTIYHPKSDASLTQYPSESVRDFPIPNMSSATDVVRLLVTLGCNAATIKLFEEDKIVSHLYPVVFEMIGMLARNFHVKNSSFRRLPNPTQYRWDARSFSFDLMLKAFSLQADALGWWNKGRGMQTSLGTLVTKHSRDLRRLIVPAPDSEQTSGLEVIDRLHSTIEGLDEILMVEEQGPNIRKMKTTAEVRSARQKLVSLVLRFHIQEVVSGLNEYRSPQTQPDSDEDRPAINNTKRSTDPDPPSWDDVLKAPLELRQHLLMKVYFLVVLPNVQGGIGDLDSMYPGLGLDKWFVSEVWCALLLRSICWLMLHDFHPKDVQIPKSDLHGSRLPVYIA